LKVTTRDRLKALSQGTMEGEGQEGTGDNVFVYETDSRPHPITLIIGDYEQKSVEVDSTLYSVWYLRGARLFSDVFEPDFRYHSCSNQGAQTFP